MNYLRIAVDANSKNRKFILFYADYLQEAWLSEVFENDTTKILKQFRCKSTRDVEKVAAYIAKSGKIVNLLNESAENSLKILEHRLNNPDTPSKFSLLSITKLYQLLIGSFSRPVLGNL